MREYVYMPYLMSRRLKAPLLPGFLLGAGKVMPGAFEPTILRPILAPACHPADSFRI